MKEYESNVLVTVKIHPDVFAQVDDEWREMFYDLNTESDIVDHIAYNLMKGRTLSQLDGFANLPNEYAVMED